MSDNIRKAIALLEELVDEEPLTWRDLESAAIRLDYYEDNYVSKWDISPKNRRRRRELNDALHAAAKALRRKQ